MVTAMDDMSGDNITDFNETTSNFTPEDERSRDGEAGGISMDLSEMWSTLSRFLVPTISCVAFLFNSFVFNAAAKTSSKTLKSKALILNSVLSDIVLLIATATHSTSFILLSFGENTASRYVTTFGYILSAFGQFAQAFSSVLLVVDRMYAVIKPLEYHTIGYSTRVKVLLVVSAWGGAVALALPSFIIPYIGDHLANHPFYVQLDYGFTQFTSPWRQYIGIGVNSAVFLLYAVIFVVFTLQRRRNRAVKRSTSVKATLSLTVTYFVIHLSSLCLYVPAPIFNIIKQYVPSSVMSDEAKTLVHRLLIELLLINTIVNSAVLATRVPSIRQNLNLILKRKKTHLKQVNTESIPEGNLEAVTSST